MATPDFFQNSARIAQNLPGHVQKFPVLPFAFLFPYWSLVAQRMPDRDHPLGHAALPVTDLFLQAAGFLLDPFHRPRQYARSVV